MDRLRHHWPSVALLLILGVHLGVNLVWLGRDQTLRAMDMGGHIGVQAQAYQMVMRDGLWGVLQVVRGDLATAWPSAGYLPWVALALVFGQSIFALRVYNLFYLAILLSSVYAMGWQLRSRRCGLLAAALLSLYPVVYGMSRQFGVDLPATAMISLVMALLLFTDRFRRVSPSLLLGLGVGLAVLVRPLTLLFFVPPALALFVAAIHRPGGVSRLVIARNAALGGTLVAGISAVWWAGRMPQIVEAFTSQHGDFGRPEGDLPDLLRYLVALPSLVSILLVVAAAVGLVVLAVVKLRTGAPQVRLAHPRLALVGVWLVAGLLIQSTIQHHVTRYIFPLLPAVALLTAVGLLAIPQRTIRRAVIATLLVGAAGSWLYCSVILDSPPPLIGGPFTVHAEHRLCGPWELCGPPAKDDIFLVTTVAARRLEEKHGDGDKVLVRISDGKLIHARIVAKAALMTTMPKILVTGKPWRLYAEGEFGGDPLFEEIHGTPFHSMVGPYDRCYSLRYREVGAPVVQDDVGPGEDLLVVEASLGDRRISVALRAHRPCPAPFRKR